MLDVDVPEDGEGFTDDDIIRTGRWSKKQKPISPSTTTVHDVWDRESFVREVKKRWTPEEETTLIQHVIRNGTRAWQEISDALAGRHSAEECQGYWKHLDMPVRRAEKQSYKWEPHKEALFWRLWLESGSDFDEISRKLCNFKGFEGAGALQSSDQGQSSTSSRITIQDCEELFTQRTQQLRKVAGEQQDDEVFRNDCVEMALMLSKPSPFKWDKEKSVKLQKLVRQRLKSRDIQVNWINWRWVARHVGGGVTAQRCCVHWRQLRKVEIDKESWTDEDILLLEQGIREIGPTFNHPDNQSTSSPPSATAAAAVSVDNSGSSSEPNLTGFRAIQRFYLPDRSIEAMQRKYFLLSDKGSTVTMREYMSVMDAVDEYGLDQWDKVVEALKSSLSSSSPSASGAQGSSFVGWTKAPCRRVWEASYRHHLLYTPWTFEEDRDLKESVDRIGLQEWVAVSRFFPGKSAWQCRLRWCQLTDPIQPAQSAAPLPDHL
ncbi:hypothetical protein BC939DRAFT_468732 [Gamsiella multidivaricata]|uniref:uncharacterized protein n=1 Tax=Gamsiella multidivaricata TaxID=101098 RepID=UPI0022211176|nr:uncharacterized protein BC939DRAFT_468732 [Gamsiella multidivaricata]KAI7816537.1 hypothetical protein BC939DRAFT_468732 [Gamsiella multidivaricata]